MALTQEQKQEIAARLANNNLNELAVLMAQLLQGVDLGQDQHTGLVTDTDQRTALQAFLALDPPDSRTFDAFLAIEGVPAALEKYGFVSEDGSVDQGANVGSTVVPNMVEQIVQDPARIAQFAGLLNPSSNLSASKERNAYTAAMLNALGANSADPKYKPANHPEGDEWTGEWDIDKANFHAEALKLNQGRLQDILREMQTANQALEEAIQQSETETALAQEHIDAISSASQTLEQKRHALAEFYTALGGPAEDLGIAPSQDDLNNPALASDIEAALGATTLESLRDVLQEANFVRDIRAQKAIEAGGEKLAAQVKAAEAKAAAAAAQTEIETALNTQTPEGLALTALIELHKLTNSGLDKFGLEYLEAQSLWMDGDNPRNLADVLQLLRADNGISERMNAVIAEISDPAKTKFDEADPQKGYQSILKKYRDFMDMAEQAFYEGGDLKPPLSDLNEAYENARIRIQESQDAYRGDPLKSRFDGVADNRLMRVADSIVDELKDNPAFKSLVKKAQQSGNYEAKYQAYKDIAHELAYESGPIDKEKMLNILTLLSAAEEGGNTEAMLFRAQIQRHGGVAGEKLFKRLDLDNQDLALFGLRVTPDPEGALEYLRHVKAALGLDKNFDDAASERGVRISAASQIKSEIKSLEREGIKMEEPAVNQNLILGIPQA